MNILVNEESKEFHLFNENISYILNVLKDGTLGHLYFGKKIRHRDTFSHMIQITSNEVASTPNCIKEIRGFCKDVLPQEYPTFGNGDYREPALIILQENGSRISDFKYKKYEIKNGKEKLDGLPASYVESESEAKTLKIFLEDEVSKLELVLSYTVFEKYDIIARNAYLKNNSEKKVVLERILSGSLDFRDSEFEVFHLSGTWARERYLEVTNLTQSRFVIDSKRGTSSANNNPFLGLKRKETTEFLGEVYGFMLVYSGNFIAQAEKNQIDSLRINMGINPFNFNWVLEKRESFQTPEMLLTYSKQGLNGMSKNFHNLLKERMVRGRWRECERPVLLNNWEATYFDFDEDKIVNIAKKAKELGVELFVLDDGWFGKRNNDFCGLGDWWTNLEKIPSGIEGLSKKIENMGLKFGLWFEPEMVNKESELYKKHPNWILQVPNRLNTESRNQHTLDLGRADVREYLYEKISKILRESKISYVKWDMNRPMTEVWSEILSSEKQGEVSHRYILGLYNLLERITKEFPEILFESCASGGNRFDAGMLYYMPQTWTSDNTDPMDRVKIQYGTSICYPISSMGAHVSASPNHQTGRVSSIETRGNVAFFGAFGYELDLNKITDIEKEKVKYQIEFFKKNRRLFQFGDFYRLISPFNNNRASWMVLSKDKKEGIIAVYEFMSQANKGYDFIKIPEVDSEKLYKIDSIVVQGKEYYGDEMMNSGLIFKEPLFNGSVKNIEKGILDSLEGDFKSILIKIESV